MPYAQGMTSFPEPVSRRDRQRQTREALVFAARAVFAEDGYHGASLDVIARAAGFSKGAVYSNFDGKAALFLAVMDANLDLALTDGWDPFAGTREPTSMGSDAAAQTDFPDQATRGFALATLEFIAAAARDEALAPRLAERLHKMLEAYTAVARTARPAAETFPAEEIGKLLAALDQGTGLLLLSADIAPQRDLFTTGMRRLLDPARALSMSEDSEAPSG